MRPCALHVIPDGDDGIGGGQLLLPARHVLQEEGNVLGHHQVLKLDLVILQNLDEVLVGLQQGHTGPWVGLVLEFHASPGGLQLLQHLLHAQLFHSSVHNAPDLVLKVVQLQLQEVGQGGALIHGEGHARGLHQLPPVPLPDGWVLQLGHGPQGGQGVQHGALQACEGLPGPDLLVEVPDVPGKPFALQVHGLHVDILPPGGLPGMNAGGHQPNRVPELLQPARLLPALPQLLIVRDGDFKQAGGRGNGGHGGLHLLGLQVPGIQRLVRVNAIKPARQDRMFPLYQWRTQGPSPRITRATAARTFKSSVF